jgi:glycosyltransferase involved in cell wall biosynthesis
MSNKRILIFSLAYHPVIGGAEIAVKEITDRLPDLEFDMVTMRFDKKHPKEERIGNVNVYRIDSNKLLFPMEASMLGKELHQKKPYDAVWSIMAARAGGAALFFKYSHPEVPYILTLQEGDPVWYMKLRSLYYINPFFKKIFTSADKVQAISLYLADYARTMGHEGEVEVIPNGVDTKLFTLSTAQTRSAMRKQLGLSERDTVLITTSRLVTKNRIGDIIESLEYLRDDTKLVIIGEGTLEPKLKKMAKDFGFEERVKFVGHVPYEEVPKYLHAADIFVRPSLTEGFGNSFIEAMSAGLPVIATPVGGIVDFLEDEKTGLFAQVRDCESVATQVRKLIKDRELRETLINNAKKMVSERYEWDNVAEAMKMRVFDPLALER